VFISFRKREPFQLDQKVVSADFILQLGTFLGVYTVLPERCDLSAEVTLTQASLFGKLDMLKVQLHQGQEGAVGGKLVGRLSFCLQVLDSQSIQVSYAHVHGHMNGGFIWHSVSNFIKEG
jgi:hypothetical protein